MATYNVFCFTKIPNDRVDIVYSGIANQYRIKYHGAILFSYNSYPELANNIYFDLEKYFSINNGNYFVISRKI